MKKTYNINLNGQAFCIDEDAYAKLQVYIDTLEKYYLAEEDGKEIMADIESRIAELLREFLQRNHKEVVSLPEIDKVIEIMGTPEVIIDEDTQESSTPRQEIKRKLYRDADHRVVGGVASGLATYFGIDSVWIRVAFIVLSLFYGVTILVYLILWIAIPKAITARQKLEMKGKNATVSNIEKNIRDTYNQVKKKSKLNRFFSRTGEIINEFVQIVIRFIGKIALVLIALLAIIGATGGTIAFFFFGYCFLGILFTLPEPIELFARYATAPICPWLIETLALLVCLIPLGLVSYLSASYLFKFHKHRAAVTLTAGGFWLLCCFILMGISLFYLHHYAQEGSVEDKFVLAPQHAGKELTVHFSCPPSNRIQYDKGLFEWSNDILLYHKHINDDKAEPYFKTRISFENTSDSIPCLIVKRQAHGNSYTQAVKNAQKTIYRHQWNNDTLHLDTYFQLDTALWRGNQIQVQIAVPEAYRLNLIHAPNKEIRRTAIFQEREKFRNNREQTQHYLMRQGKLEEIN